VLFSADLENGRLTSQTRKLAGWTALQFPWKWCNEGDERYMNADNRALALSHDMPPLVKGMDKVAMEEFFHALTATSEFGYDPETDYRKCTIPPSYNL
jgi:hypothetical protein